MVSKASALGIVIGLVLGVGAGFLLGVSGGAAALPPEPGERGAVAAGQSPHAAPADAANARDDARREPVAAPGGREEAPPLIGQPLRDYAVGEMQRGWHSVRAADAMPDEQVGTAMGQFQTALLALPFSLGEQAARAQDQLDAVTAALASGDGVQLLANLTGDDADAAALVRDRARFGQLFAARAGGSAIAGKLRMVRVDDQLDDGSLLAFGAGVFQLWDLMRNKHPFPSDVTVRGAGMDATLLVLNTLSTSGPLRRFAVEDCTVFVEGYLTDLRSEPALMAFRNVRFVGFDSGGGASVCFGVDRAAILATDCRFEGGYGRHPIAGNLIRADGPSLCRFERCSFSRVAVQDLDDLQGAFVQCTMTELLSQPRPTSQMTLEGCRVDVLTAQRARDIEWLRRDLNELFPQWREQLNR